MKIKQQKTMEKKDSLYRWIIKNNFPEEFQILCFNCNSGRHINGGICPHEEKRN